MMDIPSSSSSSSDSSHPPPHHAEGGDDDDDDDGGGRGGGGPNQGGSNSGGGGAEEEDDHGNDGDSPSGVGVGIDIGGGGRDMDDDDEDHDPDDDDDDDDDNSSHSSGGSGNDPPDVLLSISSSTTTGNGNATATNANNTTTTTSTSGSGSGRWTCDACGCHTNQSTDRTCSICGTAPAGPGESLLRRVGNANFAARAGFFAGLRSAAAAGNSSGSRRISGLNSSSSRAAAAAAIFGSIGVPPGLASSGGGSGDDDFPAMDLDDDDLWESVVDAVDITHSSGSRGDSANSNEGSSAFAAARAAARAAAAAAASSSSPTDREAAVSAAISESVMQSLVMEVAGISRSTLVRGSNSNHNHNNNNNNNNSNGPSGEGSSNQNNSTAANISSSRQRFLEAARMYSQIRGDRSLAGAAGFRIAGGSGSLFGGSDSSTRGESGESSSRAATAVDTTELLRLATRNGSGYKPRWSKPTDVTISSSSSSSSSSSTSLRPSIMYDIEVGEGEREYLAHLPIGGSLGRAVRAQPAIPRNVRNPSSQSGGSESASLLLAQVDDSDDEVGLARSHSPYDSLFLRAIQQSTAVGGSIDESTTSARTHPPSRRSNTQNDTSGGDSSTVNVNDGPASAVGDSNPSDQNNTGDSVSLPAPPPSRRVYGFRVAFDHPGRQPGENMGGCYLIGVTTSSFVNWGEQNGLQKSPFFWGIEDSGYKYEGSSSSRSLRSTTSNSGGGGGRMGTSSSTSSCGIELSTRDVPRNDADVLFGCRDVVTVVVDLDHRSLTYWRNDTCLGTLVTKLPRISTRIGSGLYPVAVPYNGGVTVAITGMGDDPLPLLRTFASDWNKEQKEKEHQLRSELLKQRAILINEGKPTKELVKILFKIYCSYASNADNVPSSDDDDNDDRMMTTFDDEGGVSVEAGMKRVISLDFLAACRLWYTCGLKLSMLTELAESLSSSDNTSRTYAAMITFTDFLTVVERVALEDESAVSTIQKPIGDELEIPCEVGDKVELVDGYEKYGDASGGPLVPGDRGIVVEIQRGANGDRRSIRVIHSGRRWWYQPQAVRSERSALIESAGVWFLRGLLRAHGYDHLTLECTIGKPLTSTSWRIGDFVAPKEPRGINDEGELVMIENQLIGRIVPEASSTPPPLASAASDATGYVHVEFVGRQFAEAVRVQSNSSEQSPCLETRRVEITKLVHHACMPLGKHRNMSTADLLGDGIKERGSVGSREPISSKVRAEINAIGRLDRSVIDSVRKSVNETPIV